MTPRRPLVISAAGCAGLFPANTLMSVVAGVRHGADVIEIDVVQTADGHLVAHHGLRLNTAVARDRTGRRAEAPARAIRDMTYEELLTWDVGRPAPGSIYERIYPDLTPIDGARAPLVEEVLKAIALNQITPVTLELELKSDPADPEASPDPARFIAALVPLLKAYAARLPLLVSSFDWGVLARLRRHDPNVALCVLADEAHLVPAERDKDAALAEAMRLSALYVGPHASEVTPTWVAAAHAAGVAVLVWGWIDPFDPSGLIACDVDGIVSVRPDLLNAALGRR